MGNDAEVKLQVKLDDSSANKSVDNLTTKTKKLSDAFKDAGTKMTIGLTTPIFGLIGLGVKYNSEMEQYQAGLETMLGSTEKANKMLADLKEMSAKTPFETTDLIKASQTMLSFGLDANKTKGYLQMLGDVSMGNVDKLDSLTLSFAQVQSTGHLMGQDLLQMIGQGFNPLQIISEKTGESMLSLKTKMEKGAISADMVTQAFTWATSEGGRFFGAMDKQSQTTEGKISTLKDGFLTAAGTLTESLLPKISELVTKLSDLFNWFSSLDSSQQTNILTILAIVAAIGPLVGVIGTVIGLVGSLATASIALDIAMFPLMLMIGGIILIIGGLVFAIAYALTHWKSFSTGFMAIANGIGSGIAWVFKGIVNTIIGAINVVTRVLNCFFAGMLAPFNAIIWGLNQVPGVNLPSLKLAIPKIPYLSTGTNNVQKEGLAYLHQGEAVVPKKYNPAMGGGSNGMVTLYIEQPALEIDGKRFANATAPYITRTLKLGGAMS